jgi:hypothetical protein
MCVTGRKRCWWSEPARVGRRCGIAGGISISGSSYQSTPATLTVTNSSVVNNTINHQYTAVGGGIVSNSADVTITGSLIANNSASGTLALGRGIAMETFFTKDAANVLTITNSTLEGNQVVATGSSGFGYSGTAAFSGALITLNSAIGGSGGGKGIGGGLYVAAGTLTLSPSTKVVANFASTSNNNIFGPYTVT